MSKYTQFLRNYKGPSRRTDMKDRSIQTDNVLDGVARLWADPQYREDVWNAQDWFKGWYME